MYGGITSIFVVINIGLSCTRKGKLGLDLCTQQNWSRIKSSHIAGSGVQDHSVNFDAFVTKVECLHHIIRCLDSLIEEFGIQFWDSLIEEFGVVETTFLKGIRIWGLRG